MFSLSVELRMTGSLALNLAHVALADRKSVWPSTKNEHKNDPLEFLYIDEHSGLSVSGSRLDSMAITVEALVVQK